MQILKLYSLPPPASNSFGGVFGPCFNFKNLKFLLPRVERWPEDQSVRSGEESERSGYTAAPEAGVLGGTGIHYTAKH